MCYSLRSFKTLLQCFVRERAIFASFSNRRSARSKPARFLSFYYCLFIYFLRARRPLAARVDGAMSRLSLRPVLSNFVIVYRARFGSITYRALIKSGGRRARTTLIGRLSGYFVLNSVLAGDPHLARCLVRCMRLSTALNSRLYSVPAQFSIVFRTVNASLFDKREY